MNSLLHLLRRRYNNIQDQKTSSPTSLQTTLQDSIEHYRLVLNAPRPHDIYYAPKTDVIHTGRAGHEFSKELNIHEVFDVYRKVPESSIRLEEIKDLFYPNVDTKGSFPRTILAVSRHGIAKTVQTEKIFVTGQKEPINSKNLRLLPCLNFDGLISVSYKI